MTFTGKSGLFWILLFSAFLSLSTAQGETIDTCSPNAMVTIGSYVVGTNYWNPRKCPGKQCLSIDNETGKFTVTKADFTCADRSDSSAALRASTALSGRRRFAFSLFLLSMSILYR